MTEMLLWLLLALTGVGALALWALWRRIGDPAQAAGVQQVGRLQADVERLEREIRSQVLSAARDTRAELAQGLSLFQQAMLAQSSDVARLQNEQIDSFRTQLAVMQQQVSQTLQASTQSMSQQAQAGSQALVQALAQARDAQDLALRRFTQDLQTQQARMIEEQTRRLAEIRQAMEQRLSALQEGNEKKLDQMRATVDEKLQTTLETRLGESFRQVAERLEQVHKGLGEMQTLAQGVGDLRHLLTNVRTRGIFGEAQLAALLEQVFTVDQYAAQVSTVPGSKNAVDFAIRLPGRSDAGQALWLPIDAKFPNEDYERLLDAQGRADAPAAEAAGRALEARIRLEARSISEKYISPPHTTDFAILFLPTEGLYAEVLRRPGLSEALQRECRVVLAGPTTLLAMLNSLQMGFRTLALEKRSSEVWQVLGAVKTEFGKFGEVLARIRTQTQTVLNTLDSAERRSRVMGRALQEVQALPEEQAGRLLPAELSEALDPPELAQSPERNG